MPPAAPRPARPAAVVPLVLSLVAASPPTILGAQPAPCVPATPRADAGSGSVRDFLAAPFTEQLVASGEGRTIAWVTTSDGRRAVRIATPGAADGGWRVRTRWTSCDDDGQEITELAVSRDGARLVWVRGGAPNRAGETPNPTSDPRGVERAIWLADTSEAAPRRVAAGASPALSPDGTRLAFIAGGALQHLALDDATATPVKLAMRGTPGDVRWSPDGTRLAFASDRGTHRIVGLYELATQRITWLEPSTDRDLALAWSPDGRQLAWVRVPSIVAGAPIFVPQRRADVPWALMVADVASGRVTRPFVADTGRGSAWQPFEGSAALHWAWDARSIIVPWEKDGWLRPWRIPLDGGAPRALTTCACEAGYVAMERIGMGELRGPDHVLVTLNADTSVRGGGSARDRYRAWRLPTLADGAPQPIDRGDAGSYAAVPIRGIGIAFLRITHDTPAQVHVAEGARVSRLAGQELPAAFAAVRARQVVPQAITLRAADGVTTYGQLFVPATLRSGAKAPAIVFIHGGSRRQMLQTWHPLRYYHATYAFNQWLASRGYVVLSLNYRSGTGYGLDFREALDYGATGASEYRDVEAAGAYLAAHPLVDSTRLGIYGGSYGGYLTAHALGRDSRRWKVGVDIHGVHDWNVGIQTFVTAYDSLRTPDFGRQAYASSPLAHVRGWTSPVFLAHGDDDRNVRFVETQMLLDQLRKQGVTTELLVLPDEVHGFLRDESWARVFERGGGFLGRYLAPVTR